MIRLVVVASLLVGCRVSLDSEPAPEGACLVETTADCVAAVGKSDLPWIEANVFNSCTPSGCHGTNPDSALVLTAGTSHGKLVNVMSSVDPPRKLVVPNDVNASMLMLMLGHVQPAQATPAATAIPGPGLMPEGNLKPICCQKLDAIERWIQNGAPTN
jgi:hypothetical protein